ncbi:MAG: hypothetical protein IJW06_04325 [Clostridia bacterium]|nr:hypothetical protein [Clostridia bacterium]
MSRVFCAWRLWLLRIFLLFALRKEDKNEKNKKGILIAIAVSLLLLFGCSVLSDTEEEHPATDTETISTIEEGNNSENDDWEVIVQSYDKNAKETNKIIAETEVKNEAENTTTSHAESTATAQVNNDDAEVWIPQSGSKYHSNSSCSNMKNPSKVSLSYAISSGYTACKRCY